MTKASKAQEVVLNFHGIGTPHSLVPQDERPYWISKTMFSAIVEQVMAIQTTRRVTFTFDDGNKSDIDIAAPILRDKGLSAIFFILSGRIGEDRYLSAKDVCCLSNAGMEIGLHGRDHIDWTKQSTGVLREEIVASRQSLSELMGNPVNSVGVPFGRYNRKVITYLKQQGFQTIYTSDGGIARTDAKLKPRTSVRCDMQLEDIAKLIREMETPIKQFRRAAKVFAKSRLL